MVTLSTNPAPSVVPWSHHSHHGQERQTLQEPERDDVMLFVYLIPD